MTAFRRAVAVGAVALSLLAGGCERPSGPRPSAAAQAACRERADAVYERQNRAELYQSDTYATGIRDSPYGNSGLPGDTSRGLSSQFARDNLISDCLNDASGNVGNSAEGAPPSPAPAARRPEPNALAVPPPP